MSVLDLCEREIAAVDLEATVADAIHKMLDHHVGAVAVVGHDADLLADLLRRDLHLDRRLRPRRADLRAARRPRRHLRQHAHR